MEMNKIAAAILLAGLIGMVTSKVTDMLYHPSGAEAHAAHGEAGGEAEVKRGYSIDTSAIEAADAAGGGVAAPTGAPNIMALLAVGGDVAAGESYFKKKCATCHNYEKGGANKTGPNMWNIVNRDKGSYDGFKYSKAMAEKEGVWDYEALNQFLYKPKSWLPGTIMAYAGTRKDDERANLIAYLRSLHDAPLPALPAAPPPVEEVAAEAAEAATEAIAP